MRRTSRPTAIGDRSHVPESVAACARYVLSAELGWESCGFQQYSGSDRVSAGLRCGMVGCGTQPGAAHQRELARLSFKPLMRAMKVSVTVVPRK